MTISWNPIHCFLWIVTGTRFSVYCSFMFALGLCVLLCFMIFDSKLMHIGSLPGNFEFKSKTHILFLLFSTEGFTFILNSKL